MIREQGLSTIDKQANIYVAGHTGLAGSAIVRSLKKSGYTNLVCPSRSELDLLDQAAVSEFFKSQSIDFVFLAAGKVGGVHANNVFRAEFIYQNLMIEANVIHSAWQAGVNRLLFLGSSCIYPRECPQPIKEEYLLTSALEHTNEPYAVAKIAGLKLCESYNAQYGTSFVSVMPTNLYGPNDHYDLDNCHVLPALIRKVHEAKLNKDTQLQVWGSGKPMREFLYVDDMADACVFLMQNDVRDGIYNVGTGVDLSIKGLALKIMQIVGFEGQIVFDSSKPDGTPKKLLNVEKINKLGWHAKTSLDSGIRKAYQDYLSKLKLKSESINF